MNIKLHRPTFEIPYKSEPVFSVALKLFVSFTDLFLYPPKQFEFCSEFIFIKGFYLGFVKKNLVVTSRNAELSV